VRTGWIVGIVAAVIVSVIGFGLVIALAVNSAIDAPSSDVAETVGDAAVEEDEDFGTVEVYSVLDDGTLEPAASGLAADVWDTFVRVATLESAAAIMTQYRVGDAPDSDTLAYVYQDESPEYWVLAANLATSDDPSQLIATLVHEYAHILSLGIDQLDPDASTCESIVLDEGCADGSAIEAFRQAFWLGYGDGAPEPSNADSDLAYEFYLANEDDFVSDYAATNVVEDFAESFMTWVLEDDTRGDSVVATKLAFFERYPDFVEIRDRIRSEFAGELGLAE
jgi:hypothetical protein